jgi:hypothetical protein
MGTFWVEPEALQVVSGHQSPLFRSARIGAFGDMITRLFSTAKKVEGRFASTYCAPDPIG